MNKNNKHHDHDLFPDGGEHCELFTPEQQIQMDADIAKWLADLEKEDVNLDKFLGLDHPPTGDDYAAFVREAANATAKAAKSAAAIETISKAKKSVSVTLRIPGPVLAAFKRQAPKHGLGYQSLVNRVLKDASRGW